VDENESKRRSKISSVNKSPEVIEKVGHYYTSTSSTTTPGELSIVSQWTQQQYYVRSRKKNRKCQNFYWICKSMSISVVELQ